MAELRLDTLSKTFRGGVRALHRVSLTVADREALFLLGPSAAGKTTTLRLVAGLERPDEGRVLIRGDDVTRLPPRLRNVAMVYDRHSLFPHLSVFDNLAYPLRNRRMDAAAIRSRVAAVAETLQIGELLGRHPGQLSGGQMQRVAIGRALVRDADVFLFDEPISHLDAKLRARMRVEFKRLQREFRATMLYVSHDQLEAMTMADRIALIRAGQIEQIAPPRELFDRPASLFAATFVGEPKMNVLDAELREEGGRLWLLLPGARIAADPEWSARGGPLARGRRHLVGVRPQHLELVAAEAGEGGDNCLPGRIFAVETLGSRVIFDVEFAGSVVRVVHDVDHARRFPHRIGAPVMFRVAPRFLYLFDRDSGRTLRQAPFAAGAVHNAAPAPAGSGAPSSNIHHEEEANT